jgi:hypothetical protein
MGKLPLKAFADSYDWFAYKLLATPRIQRPSDADAADELSASLNGNQQGEDRNEGDECLRRLAKLLGSFQTQVWRLNVNGCTRVKPPKESVRR